MNKLFALALVGGALASSHVFANNHEGKEARKACKAEGKKGKDLAACIKEKMAAATPAAPETHKK